MCNVCFNHVRERKSCNSLTHRSCIDLGHGVLSVNCVVFHHVLRATVEFMGVLIFLSWYGWRRSCFFSAGSRVEIDGAVDQVALEVVLRAFWFIVHAVFCDSTDHESGIMLESFRTVQSDHGEGTCPRISGVVVCF